LHTEQEVQDLLADQEVPILGNIPCVMCFNLQGEQTSTLVDPDSGFLSFYERVRSNLIRYSDRSAKVILISSINNLEGKSVTAYNLAIASAQAGKRTLLIEADLRSNSNANWVQLAPDTQASIEPLKYYGDRSNAIRLVPKITNLSTVISPGPLRRVAAVIESSELRNLIEDARGRFDSIIIDTPSLAESNDALLLEPLTDGMILVVRPGIIQGNLLRDTIEQLTEIELPLLGAVINNLDRQISLLDEQFAKFTAIESQAPQTSSL
jgi:polysaccharide biosynthesis transport protein